MFKDIHFFIFTDNLKVTVLISFIIVPYDVLVWFFQKSLKTVFVYCFEGLYVYLYVYLYIYLYVHCEACYCVQSEQQHFKQSHFKLLSVSIFLSYKMQMS